MSEKSARILICTPEITYLPDGMGNISNKLKAKAGGMADVTAALVGALFEQGADVHVALPHYRRMFGVEIGNLIDKELARYREILSEDRIHLAEDRAFYYRDTVYSYSNSGANDKLALAFQRELINNIIPRVKPDVIHANDWMTGLIPAYARRLGIPSLFTVHNIHTHKVSLADIEDAGIDAAMFWNLLYFDRPPAHYEETRETNMVDLLCSGIFASHFINSVSPTFLEEVVEGRHDFVPGNIAHELWNKSSNGVGCGIMNAPDEEHNPSTDDSLHTTYNTTTVVEGKRENKVALQRELKLTEDPDAPLFFWPSRLDPVQKGCQLVTDILFHMVSKYADSGLQVAVIANGPHQEHFHNVVHHHDLASRVAVVDFDERLSHLGYGAADFVLMPSLFEPCGLPQMIGCLYGSLPIAHDTGGLHDTVQHLHANQGNGFVFEDFGSDGLMWAVDQAMAFYSQTPKKREREVQRIMKEAQARFTHAECAKKYVELYQKMTERPVLPNVAT